MSLIRWDDSLSVNVKEIDNQHKKLVDIMNKLHNAMQARESRKVLIKIIGNLASYTVDHFLTEEDYFDQFGYPEAEKHKQEHSKFANKIADFQTGFNEGSLMLSTDIMLFLQDWLINHIQGIDREYIEFFHEHGLS